MGTVFYKFFKIKKKKRLMFFFQKMKFYLGHLKRKKKKKIYNILSIIITLYYRVKIFNILFDDLKELNETLNLVHNLL